jgi:hypothetical protein
MEFQNKLLSKIFGSSGEKVAKEWRILYNENFHNLYSSSDFVGVIKSKKMR